MKTYGPYTYANGRKLVVHVLPDGSRRSQSYPRFLMEQHLGRALLPTETVDHIDDDFTNNEISNFQLLTLRDNVKKSSKTTPMHTFDCPECGVQASISVRQFKHNQLSLGKAGPYCSRSCAGKAHN